MSLNLAQATGIGAGVSAGAGLVGSLFNFFGQRQQNKAYLEGINRTNENNLTLAKMQNDWNVQQWNRQNEYNSPTNQLNLLQAAGFNPNMFQQGQSTADSLQSVDLANQQAGNLVGAAQLDLNTPASNATQALSAMAQNESLKAQIAESKQRQRFAEGFYPHQLLALQLGNDLTGASTQLADWQRYLAMQEYTTRNMFRPKELGKLEEEIKSLQKGQDATDQSILESKQRVTASQQEIEQAWQSLRASVRLSDAQCAQLYADIRRINQETNLAAFRADMARKYHIDPNLPPLNNLISLCLADPIQFQNVATTLTSNLKFIYENFDNSVRGSFAPGGWFRNTYNSFANPRGYYMYNRFYKNNH